MKDWHVYLIRTGDGSLYTGITINVERRLSEHRQEGARGSRYLRGRGPLEVVYSGCVGDRGLALRAEGRLKRLSKDRKEAIVSERPTGEQLIAQLGLEAS